MSLALKLMVEDVYNNLRDEQLREIERSIEEDKMAGEPPMFSHMSMEGDCRYYQAPDETLKKALYYKADTLHPGKSGTLYKNREFYLLREEVMRRGLL